MKLPKLTLPTFDGDHTMWVSFWDIFTSIIDGHSDLTDVQKFTYLKGQLLGEAAELVKGFKVEVASYKLAVDLLKKTYGQPEKIKEALVQDVLGLTPPMYEVDSFKQFYASFKNLIGSICGMETTLDEMIAVILTAKLPSPIK